MAERVAILTDIHGNAPALRAALADIDRLPGVEHIYARTDITMLVGNHDQYVLAAAAGKHTEIPAQVREHASWIAERLDPKYVPVLAELPLRLTAHHGGRTLLLLHYHLTPSGQFDSIEWEPGLDRLEGRYRGTAAAATGRWHGTAF